MKKQALRVLVCGGRDYRNRERVYRVLDTVQPAVVIHGDARGADTLASDWAKSRGVQCETYPAQWNRFGRRAGYLRNQQMLDEGKPDLVIAFPGGSGTAMMAKIAQDAGVWTILMNPEPLEPKPAVPAPMGIPQPEERRLLTP